MNKNIAIITYAFRYIATTIVYIFFPLPYLSLICSILSIFLITLSYKSKLSKKLAVTAMTYSLMLIPEIIVAAIIGINNFSPITKSQYGDSFSLIIVEILSLVIANLLKKFKGLSYDTNIPGAFLITAVFVPAISVSIEIFLFMQSDLSDAVYTISLICVLLLNFLVFYLYDSIAKAFNGKIQAEVSQQKKLYYQNQAKIIQQSYESTRQLRHDMKNYTIALSELIKNNENEKASEYIESISGALEPAKTYCETGILSVDSIVNYKFTTAEEAGIAVNSEIAIPYDLDLPSNDLVAILGNLLDNAIEASSKAENKYINFRIEYDKGTIIIVLINSFDGNLNVEGNIYKTTKQDDSAMHGIGLRSIKSVIDKYNGEMKISHTDNEFSVKILLLV